MLQFDKKVMVTIDEDDAIILRNVCECARIWLSDRGYKASQDSGYFQQWTHKEAYDIHMFIDRVFEEG